MQHIQMSQRNWSNQVSYFQPSVSNMNSKYDNLITHWAQYVPLYCAFNFYMRVHDHGNVHDPQCYHEHKYGKHGNVNDATYSNVPAEYDLTTEEGHKIMDSTKHRNYIADYFGELYQAREGNEEYENWTSHIEKMVRTLETIMESKQHEASLSIEELKNTIRSPKTKKSPGPDNIPNEMIIKATTTARHVYLWFFNEIPKQETIPDQWLCGNITRLYKGKGTKGKCSNERGITLASNVAKVFEKMVNNRATPMVNMTDAQAGGRGRATTDHLLTLKEAINIAKSQRK